MCFSASASFGAGAVLSVIGAVSLNKAKDRSQLPFASIPFLFSVQQISEGFLWLALSNPEYAHLQTYCTYIFLFFAQIVWPIWVPLSVMLVHKKQDRKPIEKALVLIGGVISLYLAYCLMNFYVEAKIIGQHISYEQLYPKGLSKYGGFLYIIATVVPPFFSKVKHMWSLGAAILISYIITAIFYEDHIVSVWCFFASIISIAVVLIMNQIKVTGSASVTQSAVAGH